MKSAAVTAIESQDLRLPEQLSLKELLQVDTTRAHFTKLLDASKDGSVPYAQAEELLNKGLPGFEALRAALLYGGVVRDAAYKAVRSAVEKGDEEAAFMLRYALPNRAVYPGSFDPFTVGHKNVLFREAKNYDEVLVAVGVNSGKNPVFSINERIAMIEKEIAGCLGRIRVVSFDWLLAHFVERENCKTIIRGMRAGITDPDIEAQLADLNRRQTTEDFKVDTVIVPSLPEYNNVASSKVRELAKLGGSVNDFVSPSVAQATLSKYAVPFITKAWNSLDLFPSDSAANEAALQDLLSQLGNPDRHHHNLAHVFKFLVTIDEYKGIIKALRPMIAAALFHDKIYDAKERATNEERSATDAVRVLLRGGMSQEEIQEVHTLIMLSQHLKREELTHDQQLFVDTDKAILAAPPAEYLAYQDAIRAEYRHYDDLAFTKGRIDFLTKTLARKPIFLSREFRMRFEAQAELNMKNELCFLTGKRTLTA